MLDFARIVGNTLPHMAPDDGLFYFRGTFNGVEVEAYCGIEVACEKIETTTDNGTHIKWVYRDSRLKGGDQ